MNNQETMEKLCELIKELKDVNEQKDILKDLEKINEYKLYFLSTKSTTNEIKKFITDTIDKYRDRKLILPDYYHSDKDYISPNDLQMLLTIEEMIEQYVLRKVELDKMSKNNN
mgnify:CR=1 FL=1